MSEQTPRDIVIEAQLKQIQSLQKQGEEMRARLVELAGIAAQHTGRAIENQAMRNQVDHDSERIDLAIDEFHFSAPLSAMGDPDVRDAFAKGRNLLELKIAHLRRKESIHEVS